MTSLDMGFVIMAALIFGLSALFGYYILDTVKANAPAEMPTEALDYGMEAIATLDAAVAVLIGLICLSSIILAFMVRSHPVFFAISFLVTLLLIPTAAIVSNIYGEIATSDEFALTANKLPYTFTLFTFLPMITCVFSFIIAIVMFGKAQSPGGGMYG